VHDKTAFGIPDIAETISGNVLIRSYIVTVKCRCFLVETSYHLQAMIEHQGKLFLMNRNPGESQAQWSVVPSKYLISLGVRDAVVSPLDQMSIAS
jgi:hypothetical protein